jgi:L-ascorbate oxidase
LRIGAGGAHHIVGKFKPLVLGEIHAAGDTGIMEDNVPLPVNTPVDPDYIAQNQNGYCTIAQWRTGYCPMTPVLVDIPFSQLGAFVFHCHILDHEDGGMMAKIQVVSAPR